MCADPLPFQAFKFSGLNKTATNCTKLLYSCTDLVQQALSIVFADTKTWSMIQGSSNDQTRNIKPEHLRHIRKMMSVSRPLLVQAPLGENSTQPTLFGFLLCFDFAHDTYWILQNSLPNAIEELSTSHDLDCSLGHVRKVFEKVWFHRRFRTASHGVTVLAELVIFLAGKKLFRSFCPDPGYHIYGQCHTLSLSLASCIVPQHRIIDLQLHSTKMTRASYHYIWSSVFRASYVSGR